MEVSDQQIRRATPTSTRSKQSHRAYATLQAENFEKQSRNQNSQGQLSFLDGMQTIDPLPSTLPGSIMP